MNHRNASNMTVIIELPEVSAEELERRRMMFEMVGWPQFVERLIAAVEARTIMAEAVEG